MDNNRAMGIIPARYDSVRLPGKPLKLINGKTMILRVVEQAEKSKMLSGILVATDDKRIFDHLTSFGKKVVMTKKNIRTGTDRCYEAVKGIDCDIVVNIQGDEPLIDPDLIDRLIMSLRKEKEAVCTTPVRAVKENEEVKDPACVKVVFDRKGYAMYFSRTDIPYHKNGPAFYYQHIGIYAYRADFLKTFINSDSTILEVSESLEQLRILENGYKIKCVKVNYESIGVDTLEDLERVREKIIVTEGKNEDT
ncbi:MAG: 3-deoxy-manno-octulosonate cytidylyltransferase [Candidatus Delongbacteria bacterium]